MGKYFKSWSRAFNKAYVFGEILFKISIGNGIIWNIIYVANNKDKNNINLLSLINFIKCDL